MTDATQKWRRWCIVPLVILSAVGPCLARVGGGESWGGGGGDRGGGGGGGEIFFLIELLVRLILWQPAVGLVVLLVVVVAFGALSARPGPQQYSSHAAPSLEALEGAGPYEVRALRAVDPNFSRTLFMDFVQLLYVRFQRERASRQGVDGAPSEEGPAGGLGKLGPWFAARLLAEAESDTRRRGIMKVTDALVGSSRIASIEGAEPGASEVRIAVVFESNFTEWTAAGALPALYVNERWTLRRKAGVLSQGPGDITALNCPHCGSPSELRPDGTCPYCGQVVNQGDFAWVVSSMEVLSAAPRPPVDLVGRGLFSSGHEAGTEFPTVFAPDFEAARRAFTARNPDFAWAAFETRVRTIFLALQEAWTRKEWLEARPFETDSLFNMHRYWMETYERQGLTNRLEDIQVAQVVACKFDQDAWYDIIAVRIFASMRDYVVDGAGNAVSGDPHNPRTFSEYWTFIRRSVRTVSAAKGDDSACPNCGAPLRVNMAGECAYCNSRVTSGDFDWVLSAIEQDEAYRG